MSDFKNGNKLTIIPLLLKEINESMQEAHKESNSGFVTFSFQNDIKEMESGN
jgi:hypothetical protein